MKATAHRSKLPSSSYLKWIRRFPLRPIISESEYDQAVAFSFQLTEKAESAPLDSGASDYLAALDHFIKRWDDEQGHLAIAALTGVEMLRFLMDQRGMNVSDFGRVIGSQPSASLILSGKRQLSKSQIRAVANHFKIEPGLLL